MVNIFKFFRKKKPKESPYGYCPQCSKNKALYIRKRESIIILNTLYPIYVCESCNKGFIIIKLDHSYSLSTFIITKEEIDSITKIINDILSCPQDRATKSAINIIKRKLLNISLNITDSDRNPMEEDD